MTVETVEDAVTGTHAGPGDARPLSPRQQGVRALFDRLAAERDRWVARNRYRLFGRRSTCWVPSAEDRDRLL